jgi:hypothetical protein
MRDTVPWRRRAPIAAGLIVALFAGLALTVTHRRAPAPISSGAAIRAALDNPRVSVMLEGSHWDRARTNPIDHRLEQVTFFAGHQIVAQVALSGSTVTQSVNSRASNVPYGDWIAYEPALLVVLSALFVLMAGVTPWRRLRNLDVGVALSLLVPVVLFQHRYLDASMVAAVPGMAYLFVRCLLTAFGPARQARPSRSLLEALTPRMEPARRVRWLRLLLIGMALVFVMVGVSSPNAVDVLYAVMEGATTLVHGVLPYGHLPPGIIHGDTYPILSYALYTPVALVAPVSSEWNSVDAGLAVAVLAALVAAWAVFRTIAGPQPKTPSLGRPPELEQAGLRAALAWLTFPPVLITVSTGTTDVVLAAMLAVSVLLWRRPAAASTMLALAGWFKLAPFALLAVRLAPLRGRALATAIAAVVLVSLPLFGLLIVLGGSSGPADMVHAISYQLSRGSLQSVWSVLGIEGLQPLAQGCVLGLIAGATVMLWLEPGLATQRARMAAVTAAILIALQLATDYWAFLYLVWFGPLIGVSLLADAPAVAPVAVESSSAPRGALEPAPAISG